MDKVIFAEIIIERIDEETVKLTHPSGVVVYELLENQPIEIRVVLEN